MSISDSLLASKRWMFNVCLKINKVVLIINAIGYIKLYARCGHSPKVGTLRPKAIMDKVVTSNEVTIEPKDTCLVFHMIIKKTPTYIGTRI